LCRANRTTRRFGRTRSTRPCGAIAGPIPRATYRTTRTQEKEQTMIKCRHCGKPAAKNATITERGTVTQYTISRNPSRGQIRLTPSNTVCGDEHELELTCTYCGEETVLSALAQSGKYEIETPAPEQSKTHSTCDNCGGEFWNKRLHEIDDLAQRLDPGGVVPSGQCPACGALCYPRKD
jgi:hypothetical protein